MFYEELIQNGGKWQGLDRARMPQKWSQGSLLCRPWGSKGRPRQPGCKKLAQALPAGPPRHPKMMKKGAKIMKNGAQMEPPAAQNRAPGVRKWYRANSRRHRKDPASEPSKRASEQASKRVSAQASRQANRSTG